MLLKVIMEERLQKIISNSGLMSRRSAESAIEQGRVTVNGQIASLGDKADLSVDDISVDGISIKEEKKVYIMLNKPRGYVTTLKDDKGRKSVADLIDIKERVYPIGRLDMNSEGLLLFTNDGDFANKLMHPGLTKVYQVRVHGDVDIKNRISSLSNPIEIDGKMTEPAIVELCERIGNDAILLISIKEGRNRQIRKLCDRAGLSVMYLKRIQEGPLTLGNLKIGKWRYLTKEECMMLR